MPVAGLVTTRPGNAASAPVPTSESAARIAAQLHAYQKKCFGKSKHFRMLLKCAARWGGKLGSQSEAMAKAGGVMERAGSNASLPSEKR